MEKKLKNKNGGASCNSSSSRGGLTKFLPRSLRKTKKSRNWSDTVYKEGSSNPSKKSKEFLSSVQSEDSIDAHESTEYLQSDLSLSNLDGTTPLTVSQHPTETSSSVGKTNIDPLSTECAFEEPKRRAQSHGNDLLGERVHCTDEKEPTSRHTSPLKNGMEAHVKRDVPAEKTDEDSYSALFLSARGCSLGSSIRSDRRQDDELDNSILKKNLVISVPSEQEIVHCEPSDDDYYAYYSSPNKEVYATNNSQPTAIVTIFIHLTILGCLIFFAVSMGMVRFNSLP